MRAATRGRARLKAHGPQRLDDVIDNATATISWGDEVTPLLQMQLAVDMARSTALLDHQMVSRDGEPYTIKVAHLNPLIELVKAVDSYLRPLRAAKLEEMHQEFLARCTHERGGGDGPCPECEERWNWHLHEPRGIHLH